MRDLGAPARGPQADSAGDPAGQVPPAGEKPEFWVVNHAGPYHQTDTKGRAIVVPRETPVPIYDAGLRAKFERQGGRYTILAAKDDFKVGDPMALSPHSVEVAEPEPEKPHALSYVVVDDMPGDDPHDAMLKLADGKVHPLKEVLEGMRQKGDLKLIKAGKTAGTLVLFPDTVEEHRFPAIAELVAELQQNPGLLMPLPAEG